MLHVLFYFFRSYLQIVSLLSVKNKVGISAHLVLSMLKISGLPLSYNMILLGKYLIS